jgi:hypothetical protein
MKPERGTLTSLVRDLLGSEIRRRKMAQAAAQYAVFLTEHPREAEDLNDWASAPLERDALPRHKPRHSRKP